MEKWRVPAKRAFKHSANPTKHKPPLSKGQELVNGLSIFNFNYFSEKIRCRLEFYAGVPNLMIQAKSIFSGFYIFSQIYF